MSKIWTWVRNVRAARDAYSNVNSQFGEDLARDPLFAVLRDFADAPVQPTSIPLHLLRQYSAAQKHARGRKRFRIGSGALFGVFVLVPGLAYAGVLPSPVARIVQRVFDVISVPIQIPSVTNSEPSSAQSPTTSIGVTPTPATQAPEGQFSQSPESTELPSPSDTPSESPSDTPSDTPSESPKGSATRSVPGTDENPGPGPASTASGEAELNPGSQSAQSPTGGAATTSGAATVESDRSTTATPEQSPVTSDLSDEN
jgi:hypothetical protein